MTKIRTASKLTIGLGLLLSLAVVLCPEGAVAQAKTLKLSHSWVKGDIRDNWANAFAAAVEKKTGGALKFEMHPGGVLFKPKAQFDAIRKGALDVSIYPLGWTSGKFPQLALPELPGLIESPEKGARFAHSEVGRKVAGIAEKAGMKILGWGWIPCSIGAKKKQVVRPADIKGMKMRGAVKPVNMTFQSAGAAITKMPSSEVYMALQTGTLDGLFTTNSSFLSFRLYDLVKYLTMGKTYSLINGLFVMVVSPKTFAKLSPEQQKALVEAGKETETAFAKEVEGITAKTEKAFKDAGATVVDMSKADYEAWIMESKKSAWKWYREKVKGGAELLEMAEKVR